MKSRPSRLGRREKICQLFAFPAVLLSACAVRASLLARAGSPSLAFTGAVASPGYATPLVSEVSAAAPSPAGAGGAPLALGRHARGRGHPLTAAAAADSPGDGPVGNWVECEFSYTPMHSRGPDFIEPRRVDNYVFHKMFLKEDFGHLYAKLGFTMEGLTYKDINVRCFEPDNLEGVCNDCFKFIYGGQIGSTGIISPKYPGRIGSNGKPEPVALDECVGDSAALRAEADALKASLNDNKLPDTSIWCMRNA